MVMQSPTIVERANAFHRWLSAQNVGQSIRELYSVLPHVNDYGKKHNFFKESLFELTESEQARRLLNTIQADKGFTFVHYGY